jgi:hypothetical protein
MSDDKRKDAKVRPRLSASMVEDDATERLKKRARDLGLIVNAGSGKTRPADDKKRGKK